MNIGMKQSVFALLFCFTSGLLLAGCDVIGSNLPPSCSVSPASLDFGTVQVGSSVDRSFTITNEGEDTLSGRVSGSCSDYSIVSGAGSFDLGAGQSMTVTVRLSPTSAGNKVCAINTTNACANVTCTGVSEVSSTPQVLVIAENLVPDADGSIILTPDMMPEGHHTPQSGWGLITGNGMHLYRIDNVQTMPDESFRITSSRGSLAQLGVAGEFRFVNSANQAKKPGAQELLFLDTDLQILDVTIPFSRTLDLTNDGSVTATVSGVFELDGVFYLAFDVGLFDGLRTFSSSIGGGGFLELDAVVEAQTGEDVSLEQPVTTNPIRRYFSGLIGTVPVVVEVTAQLFLGFEGNVVGGASIETVFSANADVEVGAHYDSSLPTGRWSTIANADFDWSYDEPVVCFGGSGGLRVYLRPHFEVQLYSLVGPTFDIEVYGQLDALMNGCLGDAATEYEVILTAGALGYTKIKADILDTFVLESPRLTVFDVSHELRRWSNTPPPPDPEGACCFDNGSCQIRTRNQCDAQGGDYRGNNVSCAAANCPPPLDPDGACCFDNGSCQIRTRNQCDAQGGDYRGNNVSCAAANCPPPLDPDGACCFDNGSCQIRTRNQCDAQGGDYRGNNVSCAAANCPPPLDPDGACCFDNGSCQIRTRNQCDAQGGDYRGNNVSCAAANCPPPLDPDGACCFDNGSCQIRTRNQCDAQGGDYRGNNVSCAAANCPPPLDPDGACCFDSGSCQIRTRNQCDAQGGDYQGNDVSCAAADCPLPPSNNNCAGAANAWAGNASFQGTNEGAGTDGSSSCDGRNDVWWRYTPTTSGIAFIDTFGSNFDTVLSVYSSCGGTELACNDDTNGLQSEVQFPVNSGNTYRIRVAGYDGATGIIGLSIDSPEPTPTGACCFSNGICNVLTQSQCVSQGGCYQGNGTDCSPNHCTNLDSDPSCSSSTYLGSISGDTGFESTGFSSIQESWYRVEVTEDNLASIYISAWVTLVSSSGADYDLEVYCEQCGGGFAGGSYSSGSLDRVKVRWNDNLGQNDDMDILIKVTWYSGCGGYDLSVDGNLGVNVVTCP